MMQVTLYSKGGKVLMHETLPDEEASSLVFSCTTAITPSRMRHWTQTRIMCAWHAMRSSSERLWLLR